MGEIILESPDEKKLELIILFCRMLVALHALDWRPLVPDPSIYETEGPYTFINDWLLSRQRAIDHFQKHEFIPVLDWLKERCLDVPCEQRSIIHLYKTKDVHDILMGSGSP